MITLSFLRYRDRKEGPLSPVTLIRLTRRYARLNHAA